MIKAFWEGPSFIWWHSILIHLLLYGPFLSWANRVEPWVAGIPFLLVYLWGVYVAIFIVMILGSKAADKEMEGEDIEY